MNQSYFNVINSLPLCSRGLMSFKINEATIWPVTLQGHTAGFRFRFRRGWSPMDPGRQRGSKYSTKPEQHLPSLAASIISPNNTIVSYSCSHQTAVRRENGEMWRKCWRVEDWLYWATFKMSEKNECEEESCWKINKFKKHISVYPSYLDKLQLIHESAIFWCC